MVPCPAAVGAAPERAGHGDGVDALRSVGVDRQGGQWILWVHPQARPRGLPRPAAVGGAQQPLGGVVDQDGPTVRSGNEGRRCRHPVAQPFPRSPAVRAQEQPVLPGRQQRRGIGRMGHQLQRAQTAGAGQIRSGGAGPRLPAVFTAVELPVTVKVTVDQAGVGRTHRHRMEVDDALQADGFPGPAAVLAAGEPQGVVQVQLRSRVPAGVEAAVRPRGKAHQVCHRAHAAAPATGFFPDQQAVVGGHPEPVWIPGIHRHAVDVADGRGRGRPAPPQDPARHDDAGHGGHGHHDGHPHAGSSPALCPGRTAALAAALAAHDAGLLSSRRKRRMGSKRFSRVELVVTETELSAMAAPASTGLR